MPTSAGPVAARRRLTAVAAGSEEAVEPVAPLLAAIAAGDQAAWNRIIDRFGPAVRLVARNCGLDAADVDDVTQTTWEQLFRHHGSIREPERLIGWLRVTAKHEAIRVSQRRTRAVPSGDLLDEPTVATDPEPDEALLREELLHEVGSGVVESLSAPCQQLLRLLTADPPLAYTEIARRTGMKVGSIGPTRARCLNCLRRHLRRVAA